MNTLFKTIAIPSALLIGVLVYLYLAINSASREECEYLVTNAKNEKNITYINKWVQDVAIDNGYQNVWVDHDRTTASVNGEIITIPSPDWQSIGIAPESAHLILEKVTGKYDEPLSSQNIATIEYGMGRNSIVIKINHPGPLNIRGRPESSGHIKTISPQVFVYCDGARFK